MLKIKFEFVVLLILTLTVCNTWSKATPTKSAAYGAAKLATETSDNSNVTSYYRHDPYGPNTYAFGYEIDDKPTGNLQFRDERRYMNGTVEGSYGYVRPDGRIAVTNYLADAHSGYQSHSNTYEPGENWTQHKPTMKPEVIVMERPVGIAMNATYDAKQHLNVTAGQLPDDVVNRVRSQHGIELKPTVAEEAQHHEIHPTLLDIVNGKISLTQQNDNSKSTNSIGFETVNDFIPSDFPIAPFELPHKLDEEHDVSNKYERAKQNNAAKEIRRDEFRRAGHEIGMNRNGHNGMVHQNHVEPMSAEEMNLKSSKNTVKSQTIDDAESKKSDLQPKSLVNEDQREERTGETWYKQVIQDARREFLENLPNLA